MPLEIEKKYRLTARQREAILARLPEIGATHTTTDFEENTLYSGEPIDPMRCVLRLRRTADRAILTHKERFPTTSSIKHQSEDETEVADADALDAILQAIGFQPAVVYEKRRMVWQLGDAEVVIDELPFGLFMEIEGSESEIERIEGELAIRGLTSELATYPQLTRQLGKRVGGIIEARFDQGERR